MQAPLQARNDSDAAQTDTAKTVVQKRFFADNGPEALAQRKLAEMMNNSPRVSQQRALSDAIHNSPRMVAQRHEMNALFGGAVKPQEGGAMLAEASLAQREEKTNNTGLPNWRNLNLPDIDPLRDQKGMAQASRAYVDHHLIEHGVLPSIYKQQLREDARHQDTGYHYEPSDKQRAEDEHGYQQARAQLRGEEAQREQAARAHYYRHENAHGGFENRAAQAVTGVKRDTKTRIVNYAEVTRQSEVEDDWVLVDHQTIGPELSGSSGRNQLLQGPYSTANPDCADPKVQDKIRNWVAGHRGGDAANGRRELSTDVQFYDDKAPCDTCGHNIPAQVQNESLGLDLFVAKDQDEKRGMYSGARFDRSYAHDPKAQAQNLHIRGHGKSKENLKTDLEKKIESVKRKLKKLSENLKEQQAVVTENGNRMHTAKRAELEARIASTESAICEKETERADLESRLKSLDSWPVIQRKPDAK